jgi:hypothetical protein
MGWAIVWAIFSQTRQVTLESSLLVFFYPKIKIYSASVLIPAQAARLIFPLKNWLLPGLPDGTYIFNPKILIWVNILGSCGGRCLYFVWQFGLFYGHWVYFTANGSILRPFGIFYDHLVTWYIFPVFGILYKGKSGNPGCCNSSFFSSLFSTSISPIWKRITFYFVLMILTSAVTPTGVRALEEEWIKRFSQSAWLIDIK